MEISPDVKQQALTFHFPAVTVLEVKRKQFISKSRFTAGYACVLCQAAYFSIIIGNREALSRFPSQGWVLGSASCFINEWLSFSLFQMQKRCVLKGIEFTKYNIFFPARPLPNLHNHVYDLQRILLPSGFKASRKINCIPLICLGNGGTRRLASPECCHAEMLAERIPVPNINSMNKRLGGGQCVRPHPSLNKTRELSPEWSFSCWLCPTRGSPTGPTAPWPSRAQPSSLWMEEEDGVMLVFIITFILMKKNECNFSCRRG